MLLPIRLKRGTPVSVAGRGFFAGLVPSVCAVLFCFMVLMPVWAAGTQVLHGNVPATVARLQPVEQLSASKLLDLVIALPLRNRETLTNLLRQIYDPVSPHYHHYLTPEQFAERFGPTEKDYQAVTAFAMSNGLTVTGTHPNRTLLDVSGSVADIERVLHVNMRVYHHPTEARMFYGPDAEPSLDLSVPILAISGLDNFVLPRPMGIITNFFNQPSNAMPYATGSGPRGNFIGKDFRAAYAPGVSLDGSGQSVGLFELDSYYPSDIADYESLAGLPNVPVTNVLINGFDQNPGGNNVEVALDIDMAISMAPGLSKVIVYEGYTPNDVLNRMATDDSANQLSCSWGFGSQVDPVREQIFQQYAAQGQSFFQASGDLGGGAIYPPSDDPFVTVVGGTSLTTGNPGGPWASETTWSGSGGGISGNYTIPIWQHGVNMSANQGSTTMRNIPDVACLADVVIWLIANNGDEGVVGGTSAAAPLWAGFAALANQQAVARGEPRIGFINPAIYAIGECSAYASAFHDITTGNNTNSASPNRFFGVPGYDLCTGWGTPAGINLINALVAPPDGLQITPETILAFTGPIGGPLTPAAQPYSLTNGGAASLSWTLVNTSIWFNVSAANGTLTAGGSAATVTITPTASATSLSAGSHVATIWFTNLNDGFTQSRQISLNVDASPVIILQPVNQTVMEGVTAIFTVGTASNGALTYQWRQDNGMYLTNLTDGGNVFGSTTSMLTVSNVLPAKVGAYSVMVSNVVGVAVSSNAFLTIVPWRPVITAQPESQAALPGQNVTLTVTAVGSQPLAYQWLENGTNLTDVGNHSGSTTSTLTINNVTAANASTYSVVVTNALGTATSSEAVLSVASVATPGVSISTLYSFTGGYDGGNPNGLMQSTNGLFYGTTQNGGTNFAGTVFQMCTNGSVGSRYSFTGGNDGANPFDTLAQGTDGNFYGTSFQGGPYDNGTIFKITPDGALTTLFAFNITNGDLPHAGLTLGVDTNFYGTSYQGGAYGRGTVFRTTTNGAQTILYSFSGGSDGSQPAAGLVQGSDGNFYGTTYKGGDYRYGTVFKVSTNGILTTLNSLDYTNGAFPYAELAQDAEGNFYGTTFDGGAYDSGTIFKITSAGLLTNLYSFAGGSDGGNPYAGLAQGSDGNFYGTTTYGGTYGDGTVFLASPNGTLTTLMEFDGYNGANPQAPLTQGTDGSFYGTTQNGGASGRGVIFRFGITSAPQVTSQPVNQSVFAGANVRFDVAVLGSVPLSYQWQKDGTNLTDGGNISGSHNRILNLSNVATNDAGSYSVIVSNVLAFATSTGALLTVTSSPPFIVSQPTNQTLAAGATTMLSVTAFGNLPLLYQWQMNGTNLSDGGNVSGSATSALALSHVTAANNAVYSGIVSNTLGSVTSSNAVLTVVAVSAPGTTLSTLHWFSSGTGGGWPPNGLMQASNGDLYGTTQFGSAARSSGLGTIFKITTNGLFTILISFSGVSGLTPGAAPLAALVQDTNGNFYGTTQYGGTNGAGNIFKLTPDNTLINFYSFTGGSDGYAPAAALILGMDGNLYGVTASGGDYGQGNIFRMTPGGTFSNLYSFTGGVDGSFPAGALLQVANGNFYGMTGYGGASDDGTVFTMTSDGTLTNLCSFTGGTDGYLPVGALVQGTDGNLYGVTEHNTISGYQFYGTIFKISTNGTLTTLYVLNYTDGAYPYAGAIQGSDGNLYGTTYGGVSANNGTVFRITPGGALTTFVAFDGFDDGAHPESALVEGADGALYGTTTSGGPGGRGTIFRLSFTTAPQITSQPVNQTVVAGANATFSAAVFGAPQLLYQWQRNGTNSTDSGNISGSTARVLTLAKVSLADSGNYSVIVSNALGSVTSSNALLTVVTQPGFRTITQTNGAVTLVWSAITGQKYQLQHNSDLDSTNWTNLGNVITATNGTVAVADVIGSNSQRFYRVVLLPYEGVGP